MADLLLARAGDEHPALLFEDESYSWREFVAESHRRAAVALERLDPHRPKHIGVLLDNVPEYLFWIGGAALIGATIVGINPTRRGAELANDIHHTDCQFIVDNEEATYPYETVEPRAEPDDRLLLFFTSGSTGAPKAVICTQGRFAGIAARTPERFGLSLDDVLYESMPLFHGNALMANWAPALGLGATVALRRRFSASGFLPDVRRFGATYFNYVGRALAYILATPEQPDDADNPLRLGFGTEASGPDMDGFSARFGCRIMESYGSSEGAIAIGHSPGAPPGSLGRPLDGAEVAVVDPNTRRECPPAAFDGNGRLLNGDEAIGELVSRNGAARFEGYYNNPEADAARLADGWYWSGDLGYRDADGWFYFAGRSSDWLRVDSENFAAAPVERILFRYPGVVMAAVYPVPDPRTGDQVMAALELGPDRTFDPQEFAAFLADQPDLGTKWAPRFVRIVESMPLTATNKVNKQPLRAERWTTKDVIYWMPGKDRPYEVLTGSQLAKLRTELEANRRAAAR